MLPSPLARSQRQSRTRRRRTKRSKCKVFLAQGFTGMDSGNYQCHLLQVKQT